MRKIIYSVCAALLLATTCGEQKAQANAGEMAVFYDNVGWIAGGKAKEIGDAIIAGVKSFQNPKAYNLDGVAEWVEQNTRDGDVDCLVLFGYLPQTIYAPGNGEPEGSLVEEFIDNGNFVMNTADYIFYVTQGGGANAVGGLQNITDTSFDMWTDGNAIAPTADGKKYTPSLGNFTSNRSFKPGQVEADPAWEAEVVFGEGPLGYDPVIIKYIEDGNLYLNTADYIFYVTLGGGANAVGGLQNVTDSTFDMWTDGNNVAPTADGSKYLPSLEGFQSNRSFKKAQVEGDENWDYAVVFAEGPLGEDPAIIQHADYKGMVGIVMQVANDNLPRGAVVTELFNNWLPDAFPTTSVDPIGKSASLWGSLKSAE